MNTLRRTLLLALVLFITPAAVNSHEGVIPVIVDTDMALDDVRALTLLLQNRQFDLLAVVTSDGSASVDVGARNAARVLHFFHRPEVIVGAGPRLDREPPPWRGHSDALGWADLPPANSDEVGNAPAILARVLQNAGQRVTYICLGPLTNLAAALRTNPSLAGHLRAIYYSGAPPGNVPPSWNTARDTAAAQLVFHAGIPIYSVSLDKSRQLCFDSTLYASILPTASDAAHLIERLHRDERIQKLLNEDHLIAWDEAVVLSLAVPALVRFKPRDDSDYPVYMVADWDRDAARRAYLDLLSGRHDQAFTARTPVVLAYYPTDPASLREDVRPLVDEIIARHGHEEWIAVWLTNEIHRHLGIYSLLGAKMGVRARELLNASLDELTVISHAGLKPPLSCMNDGLQVSTGASLGRGTIRVEAHEARPEAIFIKGQQQLLLTLDDGVVARVRADIQRSIAQHGNLTPEYFAEIRRLALRYWLEMDRREIFKETLTR